MERFNYFVLKNSDIARLKSLAKVADFVSAQAKVESDESAILHQSVWVFSILNDSTVSVTIVSSELQIEIILTPLVCSGFGHFVLTNDDIFSFVEPGLGQQAFLFSLGKDVSVVSYFKEKGVDAYHVYNPIVPSSRTYLTLYTFQEYKHRGGVRSYSKWLPYLNELCSSVFSELAGGYASPISLAKIQLTREGFACHGDGLFLLSENYAGDYDSVCPKRYDIPNYLHLFLGVLTKSFKDGVLFSPCYSNYHASEILFSNGILNDANTLLKSDWIMRLSQSKGFKSVPRIREDFIECSKPYHGKILATLIEYPQEVLNFLGTVLSEDEDSNSFILSVLEKEPKLTAEGVPPNSITPSEDDIYISRKGLEDFMAMVEQCQKYILEHPNQHYMTLRIIFYHSLITGFVEFNGNDVLHFFVS